MSRTQHELKEVHVISGRQHELTYSNERTKKSVRYLYCPIKADVVSDSADRSGRPMCAPAVREAVAPTDRTSPSTRSDGPPGFVQIHRTQERVRVDRMAEPRAEVPMLQVDGRQHAKPHRLIAWRTARPDGVQRDRTAYIKIGRRTA